MANYQLTQVTLSTCFELVLHMLDPLRPWCLAFLCKITEMKPPVRQELARQRALFRQGRITQAE
jgi:hypothetical protein